MLKSSPAAKACTHRFTPLCAALAKLKVANAVIDGEAAMSKRMAAFHSTVCRMSCRPPSSSDSSIAFDPLHLDGIALLDKPLIIRADCYSGVVKVRMCIDERLTASQIASASATSCLLRLTYAFTLLGGRRASWPSAISSRAQ